MGDSVSTNLSLLSECNDSSKICLYPIKEAKAVNRSRKITLGNLLTVDTLTAQSVHQATLYPKFETLVCSISPAPTKSYQTTTKSSLQSVYNKFTGSSLKIILNKVWWVQSRHMPYVKDSKTKMKVTPSDASIFSDKFHLIPVGYPVY